MARQFFTDGSANVAVVTALAAAPMALIAIGVTDYTRVTVAAAQLQASVDAATLSGAASESAARDQIARGVFDAHRMVAADQKLVSAAFSIASSAPVGLESVYAGSATVEVPVSALGYSSTGKTTITRKARAVFGSGDGSCILTLGSDMDLGDPALVFNGAPRVDLSGCTLRSNKSIKCNGSGLAAFASVATGDVINCPNPYPNAPVIADIYEALKSNIDLKCGGGASGYTWSANTSPTGAAVIVTYKSGYRQINICGSATLTGTGAISGGSASEDTVVIVENGDLNVDADADISATRTTFVLAGYLGSHRITFPSGTGKAAKLAVSAGTSHENPWKGIVVYQDPRLTENVNLDWGPGAKFIFDGTAYFPRAQFVLRGVAENGPSACSKIVTYSFKSDGAVKLRQSIAACNAIKAAQHNLPPRLVE